jgi:hypothetical protein
MNTIQFWLPEHNKISFAFDSTFEGVIKGDRNYRCRVVKDGPYQHCIVYNDRIEILEIAINNTGNK